MARIDDLRLMTRVAHLYHEQGLRQSEIAVGLHLSQATVSRQLRRARDEGIVRITVSPPTGVYTELEDALVRAYVLKGAVVVDVVQPDDEREVERAIGAAMAHYVETTVAANEVIGLSSWSGTLLEMVHAMHRVPGGSGVSVIQILGGVGDPKAEGHAVYMANSTADRLRGRAIYLNAPGVVRTAEARCILLADPSVRDTVALFSRVTLALVGIGALEPSPLLTRSGHAFTDDEISYLRSRGAVGDVLLRFFDAAGQPVHTPLDERVIGMSLTELHRVPRVVGAAGGQRKLVAIRGALRGRLVDILVTDRCTAEELLRGGDGARVEGDQARHPDAFQSEEERT